MVDFTAALDPHNQRCMVHPDQRLIATPQIGGRTIMTCLVCNTEWVDAMAKRPGTISFTVANGTVKRAKS